VLYEKSIVLTFLFICLLVTDNNDFFLILLSSSSVDIEIERDVDKCEFDGLVTDNGKLDWQENFCVFLNFLEQSRKF